MQTLSKKERLCSVKDIESLFKKGKSSFVFPLKVVFIKKESEEKKLKPTRLLISVPKRNFKRAVDRNRIKRQIREGYRLQKANFNLSHIDSFSFIYVAKEHNESKFLHKRISKLLKMLEKEK